ncbi:MAG TPA: Stp1/IreP family PP2C-type Ser/Thr phosphatase [Acidimicrobiales bacterium]|nr:Stp1/IreP family PP2C-type Ser/Thr phosphatase [Acidimicrobiales bacterium]
MTKLVVGSATDVGLVRSNNQDQLLVSPGLYAVADGMGGHAAGEVASSTAITALAAAFEATDRHTAGSLEGAAKAANRAVWEQARTNRSMFGMGTTLVALAVVEREDGTNGLTAAHIGDSRLYVYRDGTLKQVTIDHSLVQELIDDGQISEAQAAVHPQRHVLTRALGVEPAIEVDIIDLAPRHGDRYLLCSDGLPREVSDDQIAAVLSRFPNPVEAAKELVAVANLRGGNDNITVVVIDVLASETSPDTMIVVPGPAVTGPTRIVPAVPKTAGTQKARKEPTPKRVTFRVVVFVVALFIVIGGAIAYLGWYGRSAYFVALSKDRVTIFQGRPGGVLWFQPTVVERTRDTASSVLSYRLQVLEAGQVEPSLTQARQYIANLVAEKIEAEGNGKPLPRGAPHRERASPTTTTTAQPTSLPARSVPRAVTTTVAGPTTTG